MTSQQEQVLVDWLKDLRDHFLRRAKAGPKTERPEWIEDAAHFNAVIEAISTRYFIAHDSYGDECGEFYCVPVSKREEFKAWVDLPYEDSDFKEPPDWAVRIDGTFTFSNPRRK